MKNALRASVGISALVLLAPGCDVVGISDGLDELPPGLAVTWFATSLSVNGSDITDQGTRLKVTFTSDGTYEFVATRDVAGLVCDSDIGEWDCSVFGEFEITDSELVIDPGSEEARLSYTLTETSLRLTGNTEGETVDLRFVLPPIPDLIGSWVSMYLLTDDGPMVHDTIGEVPTTLAITFEADGTYSYAATSSPPDFFCSPKVSCSVSGTYAADSAATEVVFDPQSRDAVGFEVQVDPFSLTLAVSIGGVGHEWSFQRLDVPTPGEQGAWYAISMREDGTELADRYGWMSLGLVLDGLTYRMVTVHPDSTETFLCRQVATGEAEVETVCDATGEYTAGLDWLELADPYGEGFTERLSMEVTPLTLRLSGTVDGASADIRLLRVPACSWAAAC